MELPRFEFNAPMFADFSADLESTDTDSFFFNNNHDAAPQNTRVSVKQEVISPPSSSEKRKSLSVDNLCVKEEVKSPVEHGNKRRSPRSVTRQNTGKSKDVDRCRSRSRSCVSAHKSPEALIPSNHDEILNQAIESLTVSAKKKKPPTRKSVFGGIELDPEVASLGLKEHPMMTRLDVIKTPKLMLRTRSVIKDALEKELKDSQGSRKRKSICLPSLSNANTAPVQDTSETSDGIEDAVQVKIPKRAQDQCVQSLSCSVSKRSVPRFADVKYKRMSTQVATEPKVPYSFTAKIEPATLFPTTRKRLLLTEPKTPQLRTARRSVLRPNNRVAVINTTGGVQTVKFENVLHSGVPSSAKTGVTELKPFSFEERDRKMLQRKEQKIKQMLEEEKKKAEFHATPLPTYINVKKEIPIPSTRGYSLSMRRTLHKYEQIDKENPVPFKAQPPTVLHKDPFIPKKTDRPILEVPDFELKTEKRAREREQFEIMMKEKEAQLQMAQRERELEQKKREEAEIMEMRQSNVHKAQPIPKFRPPKIVVSHKPLTHPMSPKFSSRFTNRH